MRKSSHNQLHLKENLFFTDILRLLFLKLHLLIISSLCSGAIVLLIVSVFVSPKYESSISLYVYNNSSSGSGTINNNDLLAAESLAGTYRVIMKSDRVIEAVSRDVRKSRDLSSEQLELLDNLSAYVTATIVDNTQLIEVTVSTTDRDLSYYIASSYSLVAPEEIINITKAGGVEVIDSAKLATSPASPRKLADTIIGSFIGIIICAAIIIWKAVADTTICTSEDADRFLEGALLGEIPEILPDEKAEGAWKVSKGGALKGESKNEKKSEYNI